MVEIHKAKPSEVKEIKKVLSDTWKDTYKEIYSPESIAIFTSEWHSPENLLAQMNDSNFYFAVAKVGNKIVGLTTVRKLTDRAVFMYRLYIIPEYQRKGVGSKLMESALETFPKTKTIRLEVEEKNEKGISFYKKQGFREIGRKIEKVLDERMPVIKMEKSLIR